MKCQRSTLPPFELSPREPRAPPRKFDRGDDCIGVSRYRELAFELLAASLPPRGSASCVGPGAIELACIQPAAARPVGPSNEPSVRRIAVRFSSGATSCIEKTIKVRFLSVASTMEKQLWAYHRQNATTRCDSIRKETPSKQRDGNQARGMRAINARCPPKFPLGTHEILGGV